MKNVIVLLLLVVVVAAGLNAGLSDTPAPLDSPAARLALRMDAILDGIDEPRVALTQVDLGAWTVEILPYFEYEGLTAMPIQPAAVTPTLYPAASENFHVLGRAYCEPAGGGPIELNARVINPVSPWYERPSALATLVHELIHVQGGGFCQGSSAELESTTQLATLEVLAAMANHGNRLALYAVLDEIRDMALAAAQYEALEEGDRAGYAALKARVYATASERARVAKSERRWRGDPATLRDILHKYSKIPVDRILAGLPEQVIPNLLLAPAAWGGYTPNTRRGLVIDDLAYVIENAEELAAGLGPTK